MFFSLPLRVTTFRMNWPQNNIPQHILLIIHKTVCSLLSCGCLDYSGFCLLWCDTMVIWEVGTPLSLQRQLLTSSSIWSEFMELFLKWTAITFHLHMWLPIEHGLITCIYQVWVLNGTVFLIWKAIFDQFWFKFVFLCVDPINYRHSRVPDFRQRAAAQERRKMVVAVSVIAAFIFLIALLLTRIVITLHMSQNSNLKGEYSQF